MNTLREEARENDNVRIRWEKKIDTVSEGQSILETWLEANKSTLHSWKSTCESTYTHTYKYTRVLFPDKGIFFII